MIKKGETTRRSFLRQTVTPFAVGCRGRKILGANDRLRIGVIGVGKIGQWHVGAILDRPDTEVPVICDVYDANLGIARRVFEKAGLKRGVKNPQVQCVRDFRKVLSDPTIDAVCIATPDHWHAYMTIEACKAGKDVFVEKPMAHLVREMIAMDVACKKYGRVVWSGQMHQTWNQFRQAVLWVQGGGVGKVEKLHTWFFSGIADMGRPKPVSPPSELGKWGWEMWQGPAEQRVPFRWDIFQTNPEVDPGHKGWSTWRLFEKYGGGMYMDWGPHLIAPLLWGMMGPYVVPKEQIAGIPQPGMVGSIIKVSTVGKIGCATDFRDVPDVFESVIGFGAFSIFWEHDMCRPEYQKRRDHGMEFVGADGMRIFVDRQSAQLIDGRDKIVEKVEHDGNDPRWELFIKSVRERDFEGACAIENVGLGNLLCALGPVAYKLAALKGIGLADPPERRREAEIVWDRVRNICLTPEAQNLLEYRYHKPWKIEV